MALLPWQLFANALQKGIERVGEGVVGRQLCELSEDHAENDHRNNRLQNRPTHSQCSLLVADFDIAPDQKVHQLAVLPQVFQIQRHPSPGWLDNRYIISHSIPFNRLFTAKTL